MIIFEPKRKEFKDQVQISAEIQFEDQCKAFPKELWFRFSKNAGMHPTTSSNPFLVSLLLLAMKRKEAIHVHGKVSARLLKGLENYQNIYHSWFPEVFHIIQVHAPNLDEEVVVTHEGSACPFSGGVDSFFTFLSLPQKPKFVIFMAGFDMPINLVDSIQSLRTSYSNFMKNQNVVFVSGSTNVRNFVNTLDWTNAHGQALAASALFFDHYAKEFYIPSSYTLGTYPKWGTHPDLDPCLSTENMKFVHHGALANRVEKLRLISQTPESYSQLRVCWNQSLGLNNCGECEKCVRTMIALKILGILECYTIFPKGALTRNKIRSLTQRTKQSRLFARELIWAALTHKKYSLVFDLIYSLLRRKINYWILWLGSCSL